MFFMIAFYVIASLINIIISISDSTNSIIIELEKEIKRKKHELGALENAYREEYKKKYYYMLMF